MARKKKQTAIWRTIPCVSQACERTETRGKQRTGRESGASSWVIAYCSNYYIIIRRIVKRFCLNSSFSCFVEIVVNLRQLYMQELSLLPLIYC